MRIHIALAASIVLSAAAHAEAPVTSAAGYIAAAGASDLYEKTSSQLVLKDARRQEVRAFATMMISDHAKTTAKVKAAAASAGRDAPPPRLTAKQQDMVDALTKASGAERERLYVTQQLMAHREALALHQGYAQAGDTPALQQVATSAVPIIKAHLAAVEKLQTGQ